MPFHRIEPARVADTVVRQIEDLILQGILRPGERLPAERDLSERLGVSRPSLREALAGMEAAGLLLTRPGSGVYVSEALGAVFPPALVRLFARHDRAVSDYLAFRRDMEGLAAERAARLGSDTDLALVDTIFGKMEQAHTKRDPGEEAQLDAEFHMAIIEAGHNVVMLHMMRAMFDLLRAGVFYNRQVMFRQRMTRETLLDQHRAIRDALVARAPARARAAVEDHLAYVAQALDDDRIAERNERVARLRVEHEAGRG